jgi:hypothetical protein
MAQRDLLNNIIEIATYLALESGSDTSPAHQKTCVYVKVSGSLPFIDAGYISNLVDYLHPTFVAKAERAVAISGHTVAQRLLDPIDPFRLGPDYALESIANYHHHHTQVELEHPSPTHNHSTVLAYLDDIVPNHP